MVFDYSLLLNVFYFWSVFIYYLIVGREESVVLENGI